MAADVIEVRVAREHDLDVAQLEPELLDVRRDDRRHLGRAGVDEDVALRRDDQIRSDVLRADVVDVADQAKRLFRLAVRPMELRPLLARQRGRLRRQHKRGGDNNQQRISHARGL